MKKIKILLTGVTGFVGSHLLNELIKQKKYEIICLARHPLPLSSADIKIIYGDITDEKSLSKIPRSIDCVIHLAAIKKGNKYEMFKSNVNGTKNILKNCKNLKQFIYISTIFVDAFKSPYTETKKRGESIVKNYKFNYTILRLPHMYESESKNFLNSKRFIFLYKKFKELRGINFEREPSDVDSVCKKIIEYIMNKKYFNQTVII